MPRARAKTCRHCGKPIEPAKGENWWVHLNGNVRCEAVPGERLYDAMPATNTEPCDCWSCTNIAPVTP